MGNLQRIDNNLIKCIRCKEYFVSTGGRNRICKDKKCHPLKPSSKNYISYDYWNYMSTIKRYFQNVLYQYYRLEPNENLRYNSKMELKS